MELAAAGEDDLPEEDRLAMQAFLQQRQTIMRKLESDDDDDVGYAGGNEEIRQVNGTAAAVAAVTSAGESCQHSTGLPTVPGAAATATTSKAAAHKVPAIRISVKCKRAAQPALEPSKKVRTSADSAGAAAAESDVPQQQAEENILGLLGDYGSSSGTEE
jgi:hypothetical protein